MHSGTLSPSRAFTTLSLIEIITTPLSLLLQALPSITTSLACLDRIQEYLKSPDRPDSRAADRSHVQSVDETIYDTPLDLIRPDDDDKATMPSEKLEHIYNESHLPSVAISFKKASVFYNATKPVSHVLNDISWAVPHGSITLVVGPPGSGKSSLLKAILGEVNVQGELYVRPGPIAYCDQSPWIPNESVQNCIVGMSDAAFDSAWYDEVVHTCALSEQGDLCSETHGSDDKTVGSRGLSLSEGQKQRLVWSHHALLRPLSSRFRFGLMISKLQGTREGYILSISITYFG